MSKIKISRQLIFSQSVGPQKKNNSISFEKNHLTIKLQTLEHSNEKKYNKVFFNQLLNNNKEKFKVSKLIKKNYNTKTDLIRKTIINNRKFRCSSMEYNNNIPKYSINNSISKKEINNNININLNNNLKKKNEFIKTKKEELEITKTKNIKKITYTLKSLLSSIDFNNDENNLINLFKSFSAYYSAFDEYIKLISSNDEVNLLNTIKFGFASIFNIFSKLNPKKKIIFEPKENQTFIKDKKNEENSFSFKSTNKETNSMSYKNLNNKKTFPININKKPLDLKENNKKSIEKINKTCLESNSMINNTNNEINDDDNINLTDLESVRFCDKISMRLIQPYKAVPKLDLSFFSCKNNNYKSKNINQSVNTNIPSKKKKKIRNNSLPNY